MESESKHLPQVTRAAAALCDAIGVTPGDARREPLEALARMLVLQLVVARTTLRQRPHR